MSVRFRRSDVRRKACKMSVTIYRQDLALTEYKLYDCKVYAVMSLARWHLYRQWVYDEVSRKHILNGLYVLQVNLHVNLIHKSNMNPYKISKWVAAMIDLWRYIIEYKYSKHYWNTSSNGGNHCIDIDNMMRCLESIFVVGYIFFCKYKSYKISRMGCCNDWSLEIDDWIQIFKTLLEWHDGR